MKITLDHLANACKDQRVLFAKVFPNGAPLTEEAMEQAVTAGLDVFWLENLLTDQAWEEQYVAIRRQALEQYEAIKRPALEQYEAIGSQAWEQYEAVKSQAWKQYLAIKRQALLTALRRQFEEQHG